MQFIAGMLLLAAGAVAGDEPPSYRETPLPTGKLHVASDWKPHDGRADLLVFFHGHPPVVCSNLSRSGKSAALVTVNFNGLSAAYAKPFADTNLLGMILSNACRELSRQTGQELLPGKLAIASFSAGYGAVREVLKQPVWRERISDLVLADSLYAGYVARDGTNTINPDHMRDFVRFAQRAARAEATMIVTHSEQVPEGYASTTETAGLLIEAVGGTRLAANGRNHPTLKQAAEATVGRFHALGYRGGTPQDHMNHLRGVSEALRLTSLPNR